MATATPPPPTLGEIRNDVSYPLSEFKRRTGLSKAALAALQRRGLRTIKVSRRKYVRGADWDAFLSQQSEGNE